MMIEDQINFPGKIEGKWGTKRRDRRPSNLPFPKGESKGNGTMS